MSLSLTQLPPIPVLPSLSSCTLCPLHSVARSVGIPLCSVGPISPSLPALLIVGQNPGYHEDIAARPFIGPTGDFFRTIIYPRVSPFASIYLTNACRCYHRDGDGPPSQSYKACRPHLLLDLHHLSTLHPAITIFTLGAPAATHTYAVLGLPSINLTSAFSSQATSLELPCLPSPDTELSPKKTDSKTDGTSLTKKSKCAVKSSVSMTSATTPTPQSISELVKPISLGVPPRKTNQVTLFHSYHPAAILRTHALLSPFSDHLRLLTLHLQGLTPRPSVPTLAFPHLAPRRSPPCPPPTPSNTSPSSKSPPSTVESPAT